MIDYLHRFAIPAAYSLLPPAMDSPAATAFLLAIAQQESGGRHRRQMGGPARGFWMFERSGLRGLLTHAKSKGHLLLAAQTLCYTPTLERLHGVIADNDTLAAVCARLLLWTLPYALPRRDDPDGAWAQYVEAWNPGTARDPARRQITRERWEPNYASAWARVEA